ncbi:hypothetical protein C2E20_4873 [Micractinium conductrix]|uniref:Uncharacterized protein n=1 Tax=Micractinium conductrix TaxID=554055 RepID=A0A2P6VCI8_9CHLO|nr:hypothetical protein C2E20_4873 [Micractinium conductrix]|eukprot:PSC71815.1 hypothetical protein C2E20_4873 [Micractinium conductrix]
MLSLAAARWLQAQPGGLMASLRATAALWSASAQLPAAFGSLVPFSAGTSSSEDPQPQPPQRQQLQKEAQAPRRRRRSQRVASILRQSAAPLQPWKLDGAPDDLTAALKAAESCQQVARLLVTQRTAVSSIHVEVAIMHMGRLVRRFGGGPLPADREAFFGACEVLFGLLEQEGRQLPVGGATTLLGACASARLPLPRPQAATLEEHLLAGVSEELGWTSGTEEGDGGGGGGDGSEGISSTGGGGSSGSSGGGRGRTTGRPRSLARLLDALVNAEFPMSPPLRAALHAALLRGLPRADAGPASRMLSCSRKLRLLPEPALLQAFLDFARDRLAGAPHDVACAFAPRLLLALELQGWTFGAATAEQQAVVAALQDILLADVEGLQAADRRGKPPSPSELRNKLGTLTHWIHLTAAVGFTPEQRVVDAACAYLQQHEGQLSQRQLGWLSGAFQAWGWDQQQHGLARLDSSSGGVLAEQQQAQLNREAVQQERQVDVTDSGAAAQQAAQQGEPEAAGRDAAAAQAQQA